MDAPLTPARMSAASRRLKAADPVLARLIARVGPCRLAPKGDETFPALVQSIAYQQLNGKAAATIHGRVLALLGGEAPTPRRFQRVPDARLRAAGLSSGKLLAMRDLAEKCLSGTVPARARLEALPDAEVIERLTAVRGVGTWTAQMFLMFRLGRPDVLPSGDYGIRKAFGRLYRRRAALPPPEAVERHARAWAPWRTVASWYLWRSLDALALALALALAAPAAASDEAGLSAALARLGTEPEPAARVELCAALSRPPLRGARAYQALAEAMERDLSDRVRLAAAKAVASWPGGEPLERLDKFLKAEPGALTRRDLALALSTEPAHAADPDATRLLAALLLDDPIPAVRRGAALGLALRRDASALGPLRRAAAADPDKDVRAVAAKAVAVLAKPAKAKAPPKAPPPPKEDAVKGQDPCRPPYGWCECGYPVIKTPPKCMTREDCRHLFLNSYRRNGLSCDWDGQDMETTR